MFSTLSVSAAGVKSKLPVISVRSIDQDDLAVGRGVLGINGNRNAGAEQFLDLRAKIASCPGIEHDLHLNAADDAHTINAAAIDGEVKVKPCN